MADAFLDMSLEDLISQKKKAPGGPKGGRGDGAGGRGAGPRGVRVGGRGAGGNRPVQVARIVKPVAGGIRKAAPANAAGRGARQFVERARTGPRNPQDREAIEGQGKWRHDLFNKLEEGGARRGGGVAAPGPSGGNYIFVSNLGDEVTEADLRELFGSLGELSECKLRFDRSGRSVGLADVRFRNAADAAAAFAKFKTAKLDGRPMVLELKGDEGRPRGNVSSRVSFGGGRGGR